MIFAKDGDTSLVIFVGDPEIVANDENGLVAELPMSFEILEEDSDG